MKKNAWIIFGLFIYLAMTLGAIGGCGGAGTRGATGGGTQLSGTISAPSGSLAALEAPSLLRWVSSFLSLKSAEAQASNTLTGVPNTNVLVCEFSNAGALVSATPVASGTTDSSGNFTINLPSDRSLSSNLIVQASSLSTCSVLNVTASALVLNDTPPPPTLNCPAANTTLNINPAAELATRAILQNVLSGGNLSNFSTAEISAFVSAVQTYANDPSLVGSTLEQTIQNIKGQLQTTFIDPALAGISGSGETAAPSGFGGTYNFTGIFSALNSNGIDRTLESGTVTVDASAKTFSASFSKQRASSAESCNGGCDHTITSATSSKSETTTGTIQLAGPGKIFFITNGGTVLAAMNSTGTVIVLPFVENSDVGLGVALKQGSGITASSVSGDFNWSSLDLLLPQTVSGASSWAGPATGLNFGIINLSSGGVLTGAQDPSSSRMEQFISCSGQSTCSSLSATLSASSPSQSDQNISGTFTVTTDGSLNFTSGDGSGGPGAGVVSSDGIFFAFPTAKASDNNRMGIIFGIRKGSGFSNSSLNGTYNFGALEENLNTNAAEDSDITSGGIAFDGAGNFTILGTSTGLNRSLGCNSTCLAIISGSTRTLNKTGTYSVNSDGTFTLSATGNKTLSGSISSDGNVAILRSLEDNNSGSSSSRLLVIGVKQ